MLTDRMIQRMKLPETGQRDIADGTVKGLSLRLSAGGARTFSFFFRSPRDGKNTRFRLGEYPGLSLAEAREKARECRGLVDRGVDPRDHAEEQARQAANATEEAKRLAERLECNAFSKRSEEYLTFCGRQGLRTLAERRRHFAVYVPGEWRDRPLTAITKADCEELLLAIEERGPVMANRVMATLSAMFSWAVRKGFAAINPALGVRSDVREISRDRVMSDEELKALWLDTERLSPVARAFMRVLMLTGQRRGEVATMCWSDLDRDRALWIVPGNRMKMGRVHTVPLSELALDTLALLPRSDGFVFSTDGGATHFQGFTQAKQRIDRLIGDDVPGWRLHDLRRTAASGMARLGVAPHVIEKILAHDVTISGVAAVYNRHQYLDERRQALTIWSDHVASLVQKKCPSLGAP